MKKLLLGWILILPQILWAHHTKDHMALQEDPQQIIAATQQGSSSVWIWLIVIVTIVLGFFLQKKK